MSEFTVVGHHLAQHADLSLTAIGLATHIQSLPEGSKVGIKSLAAKFPEGEVRIAAALRELEAHGYLERIKERLPSGRIVTRTISYDKPPHLRGQAPPPEPPEVAVPPEAPRTEPKPRTPRPQRRPLRAPQPDPQDPEPGPATRTPAVDLLIGLRTYDPRLLLSERDVRRLAPAAAVWLARGMTPGDVKRALTAGLPTDPIRYPAALMAHRLTAFLPPELPPKPEPLPGPPAPRRLPLQNCDGCDRAFRAAGPGACRACAATACAA
ncbi:helix-turn-helix domain-containing protein [Streptomyces sp. NPDC059897]|uniref:helix-turn-helix domain-containing protein n=1 Tax=Streptomyces sp. NPDC059897 TaxID=3346994 RepID=UPI00365E2F0F